MYTKFYDNTITTKFIKNLVAKTNVPFISTWKPGDFAIRGMLYLTKDAIWKCLHTGFPKSVDDVCNKHTADFQELKQDGSYGRVETTPALSDVTPRFFTRVNTYVYNDEYYNVTGRYVSHILGYDATTHKYLGLYLRILRDVYDLDLMPFYNCYANELVSDIDFTSQGKVVNVKDLSNSVYKILSVPVRFGKTYIIAINSEVPIETMCVIYGEKGILHKLTENLNDKLHKDSDTGHTTTYKKYLRSLFLNPIFYTTPSWELVYNKYVAQKMGNNKYVIDYTKNLDYIIDDNNSDLTLGQFEKNLRLLIKVPKTNKSSVVVIEGDYSVTGEPVISSNSHINSVTWNNKTLIDKNSGIQYGLPISVNSKTVVGRWVRPEIIENLKDNTNNIIRPEYKKHTEPLLSPLGLLLISDGNTYAFSNRLVEYLTLNAISHLDTVGKDIERILTYSKSSMNQLKNGSTYGGSIVPGVWDEGLQTYLYNLIKNSSINTAKVDLTGYADKDVEKLILRGLNPL